MFVPSYAFLSEIKKQLLALVDASSEQHLFFSGKKVYFDSKADAGGGEWKKTKNLFDEYKDFMEKNNFKKNQGNGAI